MKPLLAMGLLAVFLFGVPASRGEETPQGSWKLIKGEADGKELTGEQINGGTLVINGDRYTVMLPGKGIVTGTEKLDPTKALKTIDIKDATGSNKGKTCLGIYELHGNLFRVAFAGPGRPRPTAFATKPDSGQWMHVWQRVED